MLPKLCPAVMLAICTTLGSVAAMCASGMAQDMPRRQTLWQRWSYYYLTPVRPNMPLRHPGPLPRDAYAVNSVCPVVIPPSLIVSAPALPSIPVLGLRQSHFNPAVLPPPALRLIRGAGPILAIALSEQALGRQGKMLL